MAVTRQDVIDRLGQLGYDAEASDSDMIDFEIDKFIKYTLNYCNISAVPEIVEPRLIDRICAEILSIKKNTGQLPGFDYDAVIKSIREGDTTIDYAVGSGAPDPESRFDAAVRMLEVGYDKWITPHRRLRW